MGGMLVAIVGPSGAGKDTLILGARETLRDDPRFVFCRRAVTRHSSDAEDHDTLSPERFAALRSEGAFALAWEAHGLSYGIPRAVEADLACGRVAVCNLSRRVLADAQARFSLRIVLVTAPRAILRERLLARGRETPSEVDRRLDREAGPALPAHLTLVNVEAIELQVRTLAAFLRDLADEASGARAESL